VNFESSSFVPLQQASLCLDCDVISAAHTRCLACGSQALLNVARALSRPNHAGFLRAPMAASSQRKIGDFLQST